MNNTKKVKRKLIKENFNIHHLVIVGMILILVFIMSFISPYFLTIGNIDIMINNFIMEAIMALGMTLVIISGGTDLSISGILPLTSIVLANLILRGVNIPLAICMAIAVAISIGYINSLFIKVLKIHPFIITMSTMLILKGLNLAVTDGKVISSFPETFAKIGDLKPFGISLPVIVFVILAIIWYIMSKNNKKFLQVYFVGGNVESARLSGINVEKVLRFVYVQSALLAGIAGVLSTFVYNSASCNFGQGVELRVITAVAIGGTSLTKEGIGSIKGTLLGSLFMALIYNSFVMSGISTYYQDVVTGIMLVVAVLFSEAIEKKRKNQA